MRIFAYECVTAGGCGGDVPASLRHEGCAMLQAVVEDLQRVPDVSVVTLIDEGLTYKLGDDCRYIDAPCEAEAFEDIAAECEWTLVIAPEIDHLLLDRSKAVLDVGGRLLGSAPGAIQLTADKLALAEFWRLRRVLHPWTDAVEHADGDRSKGPWVLKPRQGAGSQSIYLVEDLEAAAAIARAEEGDSWDPREFIVQSYVPGQAASVAILIGPRQTIALLPARQHLSSEGRFRYQGGSLPLPAPLAGRATRIALQAVAGIEGLSGYVGVDLVLGHDGRDYAIEINPRLTTSYLGLRQLGQDNLADLMLRCANGESIASPIWRDGEVRFEA